MDLKKIEALVKIIDSSSLGEFTLEDDELKVAMRKPGFSPAQAAPAAALPASANVQPPPAVAVVTAEAETEDLYIVSPIVGTFYAAPAPEAPPFVKEGDRVKNGQTVCILEAMKLMNEIQSEFDCEIEAVLVGNEQKVEYGQPLFRVRKL